MYENTCLQFFPIQTQILHLPSCRVFVWVRVQHKSDQSVTEAIYSMRCIARGRYDPLPMANVSLPCKSTSTEHNSVDLVLAFGASLINYANVWFVLTFVPSKNVIFVEKKTPLKLLSKNSFPKDFAEKIFCLASKGVFYVLQAGKIVEE